MNFDRDFLREKYYPVVTNHHEVGDGEVAKDRQRHFMRKLWPTAMKDVRGVAQAARS
jgi:hypothetical protein